jgi:hypothetical protein
LQWTVGHKCQGACGAAPTVKPGEAMMMPLQVRMTGYNLPR